MQARLAAKDLACRRGERLLFRGVGFACEAGETIHVAGPNGIGKSSLIRILAGLLRPFAGSVERSGGLGLVDDRLALDENLPLGKALAFWAELDGSQGMDAALELLALDALRDVPVRFLSTGQRKRAALARLVNRRAPIWLLDEPLNGLDDQACRNFETLIARHCDEGGLAVIASHQPIALRRARTIALAEHAA